MAIDPTATPNSLAEMTRLLGGDLSGSLSTGDKLLALSGLLRSATRSGRRAGLTPQQVIGDIQQRKLAELQARLQLETLRQSYEQRQRDVGFVARMLPTLSEEQAAAIRDMDPTSGAEQIRQILLRQRQAMWRDRDPETGNMRITFGDGTFVVTDQPLPPNGEYRAREVDGRQMQVWTDKDTGKPILDPDTNEFIMYYEGESPYQQLQGERYEDRTRAIRDRAPSGGRGLTPTQPAKRWVFDPNNPDRPIERQVYRDGQGKYRNVQTHEEVTLWGGDIPAPRDRGGDQ